MAINSITGTGYSEPGYVPQSQSSLPSGKGGLEITEVKSEPVVSDTDKGNNGAEGKKLDGEVIKDRITKANNTMKNTRTRAEFTYHEKINRVSIKILDEDTNEVIREIPPEATIETIEKMWEMLGLFVDEKR